MIKEIKINPVAKPRMTQRDRWKKRDCVNKYYAFKDELRLKTHNFTMGKRVGLYFYIPFPKSYSKKKRNELYLKPHQEKPDIDNLIKAVLDCLLEDDKKVWHVTAHKVWAFEGMIQIENLE